MKNEFFIHSGNEEDIALLINEISFIEHNPKSHHLTVCMKSGHTAIITGKDVAEASNIFHEILKKWMGYHGQKI